MKKIAVVTGAHQGIGQAVAMGWASLGATVICGDIQDCAQTLRLIEAQGGTGRAVKLDVADWESWESLVKSVNPIEGRIVWLANMAGIVAPGGLDTALTLDDEDWHRVISVNLKSVWLGMKSVIPSMIEAAYGRIVNMSSAAAVQGAAGLMVYSATKAAICAITRQTAVEYAAAGIGINAVAPGVIDSPMNAALDDAARITWAKKHVVERLGTPRDVAAATNFLVSDDADFFTGHVLPVDGGWTIRG